MKQGNIELVVFDWAGTMVDYGSQAPVDVFGRTFAKKGITLTKEEINKPMGMEKKAHIRTLLGFDRVAQAWQTLYGQAWTEADVEELYEIFESDLYQVVLEYAKPIDGVVDTMAKLKDMGLKIGSTTGYTNAMMERVVVEAASHGVEPSVVVTPDLVGGASRPAPFMLFACMQALGVNAVSSVVKVGDTQMDILEGKNAGAIAVGLLVGSNAMGLTKAEYDALSPEQAELAKAATRAKYEAVGADFIIDDMTGLLDVLSQLQA